MKTETQIAQENVDDFEKAPDREKGTYEYLKCQEHKATCQRFLEFLEESMFKYSVDDGVRRIVGDKITDLKQAIKLYNEAGI